MQIATWNVNSLRVRLPQVLDWLKRQPVDVLLLQETKLTDDAFPHDEFERAGYHAAHSGQKTYNGVAIVSRHPLADIQPDLPGFEEQKRLLAATVQVPGKPLRVISAYAVNGQEVGSDKYAYKLRFMEALREHLGHELERHPALVVAGDFNVAPEDRDVHDPEAWREKILCSTPERERFRALLALGLADTLRRHTEAPGIYTWWDYRQGAFRRNLGLRIDHILASQALAAKLAEVVVDLEPRRNERPSDHAPVIARFAPA